jgi:hypothetical protein
MVAARPCVEEGLEDASISAWSFADFGSIKLRSKANMPPAQPKAQQKAVGVAPVAKHGEEKVSNLKGASKSMYVP